MRTAGGKIVVVGMLVALLGGCGSDGQGRVAAPKKSTVVVKAFDYLHTSIPAPGVDVVLSDATGAVFGQAQTDASGQASLEVPPGSRTMVTIVPRDPLDSRVAYLQTVVDAEPGDVIPFGINVGSGDPNPKVGTLALSIPTGTVDLLMYAGGTGTCTVGYNYFSEPSPALVDVTQSCLKPGTDKVDIVLGGYGRDYDLRAFTFVTDVVVSPTGVTNVPFPSGWGTDFAQLAIGYTNPPADGALNADIVTIRQSQELSLGNMMGIMARAGVPGSMVGLYPRFATGVKVRVNFGNRTWTQRLSSLPSSVTVDLATLLPALSDGAIDTSTSRPTIAWTASGGVSQADYGETQLGWNSSGGKGSWYVKFPPTATSPLRLPELPASLASFAPPPGVSEEDSSLFVDYFRFVESTAIAGYPAARRLSSVGGDYTVRETYLYR